MKFYVSSSKHWVANPDRELGGWWCKTYVVVCASTQTIRSFSDSTHESFLTPKEAAQKAFPEHCFESFDIQVFIRIPEPDGLCDHLYY